LVIGLPGTGDSGIDEELVEKSIVGVLRSAGLDPWRDQITPGRVAKVVVTAEMPTSGNSAEGLAVTITAIGDATSLAGGTLLATPLRDAAGDLYALGQGEIGIGVRRCTRHGNG
jgi:flagellar P-ring protein precursor FlgI